MDNDLFRKKSLEKIKSPENIDDFIRVSNPGVWLLLVSVIMLLAGMFLWGILGHIDSTAEAKVYVENGNVICYVSEENATSVKAGMNVEFENFDAVVCEFLKKESDDYYFILQTEESIPNGLYDGKIVISTTKPISFVMNRGDIYGE